jgi:aspartate aminotransferase
MSLKQGARPELAQRLAEVEDSPTMAVMAEATRLRAQGEDVVDWGAGEPDFNTPEHIKEAGQAAIRANQTRYTPNPGTPELRKAVAERYGLDYGLTLDPAEVLVTHGGKHGLFNLMMALVDPGDEVVIPNPHWLTFSEQARLLGAKPVLVETEEASGFRVTSESIERSLGPRTKLVVVCSPGNPTGAVIDPEEFLRLADLAGQRGFYLLWDDTYGRLSFVNLTTGLLPALRERAAGQFLIAGSASKSYAMTGWRLGWAIGPKEVIRGCAVLQSHMTSNASSISQQAALVALSSGQEAVERMREEYRWRRDRLQAALVGIDGLSCALPGGGFYLFPRVAAFFNRAMPDSTAFARRLLEQERVAVVPGQAFGRDGYVRVSFATSRERIEEGIRRLARFLNREG